MFGILNRLFAKPVPAAVPTPVAPAPPPAAPAVPPAPVNQVPFVAPAEGESIPIAFSHIVAKLPPHLAPTGAISGYYFLPIKTAVEQLPAGAVRIRFAQLRASAPPGSFPADASLDENLVDIPLANVLAGLNPSALSRRTGQTRIDAPADISGVFDGKIKSAPRPPEPAPTPVPVAPPAAPAPAVPASAPTPIPAAALEGVVVKLSSIYENWPEPIRQEIASSNWQEASVGLSVARLETAMKIGRVTFTWGELKQGMNMPAAHESVLNQDVALELPLKVIAPLFMAQRAAAGAQRKIVVGDNIPNLFSGLGRAAAEAAPAPAPAPVAPAPAPAPEPVSPPAKSNSPQDIVKNINALPGVAGCLVTMSDGLLVAGQFPAPFKPDTVAAFLPQIFGRVAHYSGEIQFGTVSSLTLTAGQTPLSVYKAGGLYLAVLGQAGGTLPDAVLQRMAGELANCKQ